MTTLDTSTDIVILAAGRGRRSGLDEHKALVPALGGQGTLERLLGQLRAGPVGAVTIVTGYRREAVEHAARSCFPQARFVHNERFARTDMLQSLARAFAVPAETPRDCWVLAADTLYADTALAALWAAVPGAAAIAVTPSGDDGAREVEVAVAGETVVGLGVGAVGSGYRMAHAVRWPARHRTLVLDGARDGYRFQWQVLQAQLDRPDRDGGHFKLGAIMLPVNGAFDIDTAEDLGRVRAGSWPSSIRLAEGA